MSRDITPADYETAAPLLRAGRPDEEVVAALKYRGLTAEDASKIVHTLKEAEASHVQPGDEASRHFASGAVFFVAGLALPYFIFRFFTELNPITGAGTWIVLWVWGFKHISRGSRALDSGLRAQSSGARIFLIYLGLAIFCAVIINFILALVFPLRQ
jgi:hypothetical protein